MKFYKKIDLYLLENHPLLWHSKIHLLVSIALLLNSSFYLMGYFHANIENLQNKNILKYYYDSALFLHTLAIICSITIWALFFFRNNALKSKYRIQRFYISKLLLILSIGFFSLSLPYITFQKGILQATKNYEAVEILNNEIKDYNKAKYFLVSSTEEFNLEKATYPLPLYEYQTVEDDKNSEEDRFQIGLNEWKDSLYVPEKHPENTFKIAEKEIQFYKEKYKLLWKDECDSEYENYISTILNPKLIHSKYYFSCEHFSGDLISTINKKSSEFNYLNTYSASGEKYSKNVYTIIKTKNKTEILKILNRFKSILLKHKIENNLNVDVYTDYLIKNDFIAKKILIYDQKPYYATTTTPNFKNPDYYDTKDINAFYFKGYDFQQLIENCNTAFKHEFEYSVFWIFYMICFIASLIVIAFEVFPIIQIFISIAIFGVIFTANVLIQVFIQYSLNHNYYTDREMYAIVHCFIIVTLFLAYAIISQNWKGKKWLTTQLTLIGLFVVGGFIPFTIMILDKCLTYKTMSKCSEVERIHSMFYPYINIFVFSITFFLSIIAYTSILKKYTSKKE